MTSKIGLFFLAALAFSVLQDPAVAKPPPGFGDLIDNFCTTNNRTPAKPYDGDCALCHAGYPTVRANTTNRVQPNWNNFLAGRSSGDFSTFCAEVAPENNAPDGQIVMPTSDVTIQSGQSVVFQGGGSDPDGDTPLAFQWTFGGAAANSSLQNPGAVTFTNANAGTLDVAVRLTVTDSLGLADPTPAQVTVHVEPATNAPPTALILSPGPNSTIELGQSLLFQGGGDDPDGDALEFYWDFGGGAQIADPTAQNQGLVVFDNAGLFAVRLTVTDAAGQSDTTSVSVLVSSGGFGTCTDNDADLFNTEGGACGPKDCRDNDPNINPGQYEICDDGKDNDCDGQIDDADDECKPDDQKTACELYFYGECRVTPNEAPIARNDTATTREDEAVFIPVLANDEDPDGDPISIVALSGPGNGTTAVNGMNVSYTPDNGFVGSDSFTYAISDGKETASAVVTVTVTAAPIASNVQIISAEWVSDARELKLRGSDAGRKATVQFVDPTNGTVFGFTQSEDDGRFEVTLRGLAYVPCAIQPVSNGQPGTVKDLTGIVGQCTSGGSSDDDEEEEEEEEEEEDDTPTTSSVSINQVRWNAGDSKLTLLGNGAGRKQQVTIVNAATGTAIGSTRSEDSGRWKIEMEKIRNVPCTLQAVISDGPGPVKDVRSTVRSCSG